MKKIVALFLAVIMLLSSAALAEGMTAGTYQASAQGYHGSIVLKVTVDADKITGIEVVEQSETEGIGAAALPMLVEAVLANQTIGVDAVTGATITSDGFKAAMKDALTQAGADMDKMTAAAEKNELKEETLDTDIVVVGAGAAGLTAALTAAQNGRSVILLEKTGMIGGASATAGAGTIATGSRWQQEDGYEDSPEKLVEDMMANGHQKNDRATVELFSRIIGPSFDWLVSDDGAAVPYKRPGTAVRNYSGVGRGAGVIKDLGEKFTAAGGTLMLSTPAKELIVKDGAVCGVKAESADTRYTINAKAVILASGGYGANADMLPKDEDFSKYVYAGHAGAQGDAIAMTESLNADLINMEMVNKQPHSMKLPSGGGRGIGGGPGFKYNGGFMVNQDGVRFLNEVGKPYDNVQLMKQNDAQYLIMDQQLFEELNASMNDVYSAEDVEKWTSDDYTGDPVYKKADTLEELGAKLNMPAGALTAAAKAFNDAYASGQPDAFGRTLNAPQSEEGPYYALRVYVRYYATLGGLHINDNMQVLTTAQEAIPGLYAAGEVVGGLEGDVYMSATLFGWAIASGHTAGQIAAEAIAE